MTAQILDGKAVADDIKAHLRIEVERVVAAGKRRPGLAVILVGENPASQVYVRNKRNSCEQAGILSELIELPASTSQDELLSRIGQLNQDPAIDGILVQLPLPKQIDENRIIEAIEIRKDVDGFHPYNVGRLALRMPLLRPCTPKGVMTLLERTGQQLAGLDAVVVGQSNIVGRPMALELLAARCTVTICHSRTRDLEHKIAGADVLVAAVGIANFVKGEWIKPGALVIDVGINRLDNSSLCGDVDFAGASARAAWITPVPGGVGPMTVATLLENTFQAYLMHD
jgi:methylenetetrahydrofolate dehydrogenase (NADP+)/methenyltetrahydrofolate cyclohydrolase